MAWNEGYQVWLSEAQSLENAQLVANHFKGSDWTKESISALVGNMRHESSVNPNMYEYGKEWADDWGFGLVQWTPRSKFWDWGSSRGYSESELRAGDSQLDRIDYEVENNIQWVANGHANRYGYSDKYDFSFAAFRANSQGLSVEQLTEAFMWNYEGPNYTAGSTSLSERQAFARTALNSLDWTGTGGGGVKPALPVNEGTPTTDKYGQRIDPISGEQAFHAGLDYAGNTNDPIYATMSGTVMVAEFNNGGLGNVIWIKHDNDNYFSAYAHLETFNVSAGDKVTKGQQIGGMGTTGYSTGVHLHFVIATVLWGNNASNTIDPEVYLATSQGGGGDTSTPSGNVSTNTNTTFDKYAKGYEAEMIYTVKSGDTLSGIASKYGSNINAIATLQDIQNKDRISVGQKLYVPVGKTTTSSGTYTVKSGDTLSGIATKFGTTTKILQTKNGISNPDKIYVGQVLKV